MSKETEKRARQLREAAAAKQRRQRNRTNLYFSLGVAVIVGLLITIVVVAITSSQKGKTTLGSGPQATPSSITSTGALPIGKDTAPVTLSVYLDYQCPACKAFEEANASEIEKLVADGTLRVELHPMTFLDPQSGGTKYSTRAANAVATVSDKAPDALLKFNNGLYAHQPAEGGTGLDDAMISEIAVSAGVPKEVADTFTQGRFVDWAGKSNEEATKAGVSSTPTLKINGEKFEGDAFTAGALTEAIKAAAAKAGSK
ncbi:MAG: thioredoxin domain-containing protein [Kineosporiaceae bacterium]